MKLTSFLTILLSILYLGYIFLCFILADMMFGNIIPNLAFLIFLFCWIIPIVVLYNKGLFIIKSILVLFIGNIIIITPFTIASYTYGQKQNKIFTEKILQRNAELEEKRGN